MTVMGSRESVGRSLIKHRISRLQLFFVLCITLPVDELSSFLVSSQHTVRDLINKFMIAENSPNVAKSLPTFALAKVACVFGFRRTGRRQAHG
jgi:hypothetical protein